MPRLPPVLKSPHTRLRATFCAGVGNSVVTFDQSHSSSSATNCAKPVSVPCPISERAIRITTVSSGRISTQAFTSLSVAAARTSALPPNGILKPSARPLPAAAVRIRNERRSIVNELLIMALPSLRLGGRVNRLAHLLKGAAAADIGDGGVDVAIGRFGLFCKQSGHRHDHAGLAVAALGNVMVEPSLLDFAQ